MNEQRQKKGRLTRQVIRVGQTIAAGKNRGRREVKTTRENKMQSNKTPQERNKGETRRTQEMKLQTEPNYTGNNHQRID